MHHILVLHNASKYKRKLIKKMSEETLITSVARLCVCVSIWCVCVCVYKVWLASCGCLL